MFGNGGRLWRLFAMSVVIAFLSSGCAWIARASVGTAGGEANGASAGVALSADGRFVVFESRATSLSPMANGQSQIYRRDLVSETTELVSRQFACSTCRAGDADSTSPDISADGRFVAFVSESTNLVTDTNGFADIFVVDMVAGSIERVSVNGSGGEATGGSSGEPTISASGGRISFSSTATDLVAADGNGVADVFVRDLGAGTTTLISVSTLGGTGNGASLTPVLSGDGLVIAFFSAATDLVPGGNRGVYLATGSTITPVATGTDPLVQVYPVSITQTETESRSTAPRPRSTSSAWATLAEPCSSSLRSRPTVRWTTAGLASSRSTPPAMPRSSISSNPRPRG